MEALLNPARLSREIDALAAGRYFADAGATLAEALSLFRVPQHISTVECAERYRKLPGSEAGAIVRYDRWRTPYNIGPMNSLDDPGCRLMVMVKPSRSGGTTVAENYAFKMQLMGPMGHICWILNSDEAAVSYCRNTIAPMYELNPELKERVGRERSDDLDTFKRVDGYPVEWLSAKDSTFRNREPVFMVSDETDAWPKKYAGTPKVQIEGRQKNLGNRRKAAIMSHPDLGLTSGVAACFEDSTRGIFVMRCPKRGCRKYASAHATRFWDRIPEFKLAWARNERLGNDERISLAERTAAMVCPHCSARLNDAQREAMIDEAVRGGREWLHRGMTFDPTRGATGTMAENDTHGYWVHGLMLKTEALAKLAREYESALIKYERTQDVSQLKEFLSKQLGEIFEGAATTGGVSARALKERAQESEYERGIAPDEVLFVTAAVDTGGRYFDVMWLGWDLEARSWLLDRQTIRQREHEPGRWRDVHLAEQIDDWLVLLPMVADRLFPLAGRPDLALPVAVVTVDSGDGNVTWKAREFARRSLRKGYAWGKWSKVKLIKGFAGKRPILADARKVDKDELGRPVEPVTLEYNLGADRLKELTLERLAVTGGKPGECQFPLEIEGYYLDQFFGELLIDGKWRRVAARNESLDLYGYNEAARLLLRPDNEKNVWDDEGRRPVWARPVALGSHADDIAEAGAGAAAAKGTILERFDGLNKRSNPKR